MSDDSTGSYRLAEQIGGWAVFAEITLSAFTRSKTHALLTVADELALDEHGREIAHIEFGIAYAVSCMTEFKDLGFCVQELHTNPVDTTPLALAFASCHAALKCLKVEPTMVPYFDRQSRSFVFPARGLHD